VLRRYEPLDKAFLVEIVAAREFTPEKFVLFLLKSLPADAAIAINIFTLNI
jgi:hypothetical protein